MEQFRIDVRLMVCAARGVVDKPLVTGSNPQSALDRAIVSFARDVLPKSHMRTFYFAYWCEPDWEAIQDIYDQYYDEKIDVGTLQKYAREAIKRLEDQMGSARQIEAWEEDYYAARKNK